MADIMFRLMAERIGELMAETMAESKIALIA